MIKFLNFPLSVLKYSRSISEKNIALLDSYVDKPDLTDRERLKNEKITKVLYGKPIDHETLSLLLRFPNQLKAIKDYLICRDLLDLKSTGRFFAPRYRPIYEKHAGKMTTISLCVIGLVLFSGIYILTPGNLPFAKEFIFWGYIILLTICMSSYIFLAKWCLVTDFLNVQKKLKDLPEMMSTNGLHQLTK